MIGLYSEEMVLRKQALVEQYEGEQAGRYGVKFFELRRLLRDITAKEQAIEKAKASFEQIATDMESNLAFFRSAQEEHGIANEKVRGHLLEEKETQIKETVKNDLAIFYEQEESVLDEQE